MTAEQQVLESHGLPQVAGFPAPWNLRGEAFISALRLPPSLSHDALSAPPSATGKRPTGLSYLVYVDYHEVDCGPYRELLFSPGAIGCIDHVQRPTITRILVSTYESVVNGRNLWGIPKDRADFEVVRDGALTRVTVTREGRTLAQLAFSAHGPALPASANLLPGALRTIAQHWRGQEYRITLRGSGRIRCAKLRDFNSDGSYFPDLSEAKVRAAVQLRPFHMVFPPAAVSPLQP